MALSLNYRFCLCYPPCTAILDENSILLYYGAHSRTMIRESDLQAFLAECNPGASALLQPAASSVATKAQK
jgi:hypothetical protein